MQVIDGLDRKVELKAIPRKIISLVPSLTELLYDLGLANEIVGVTKFCIHPATAKSQATVVGGTKNFHFDKIDALEPDLIIANKEENYKEGIEVLIQKYPVYVSDIFDLDDAVRTIEDIGKMTNRSEEASEMGRRIRTGFDRVRGTRSGKVLYFIWQDPDMVAGAENFIDFTLDWLGFENCAGNTPRYPQLSESEMLDFKPDYVFLSSEPYPFKAKHFDRYQQLFPMAKVLPVDGEMFSWYGSRLQLAPDYFNKLKV